MVYETKLPRQASTSTVTEDFSEDSEVLCKMQRGQGTGSNSLRMDRIGDGLSSNGAGLSYDLGVVGTTKILGL